MNNAGLDGKRSARWGQNGIGRWNRSDAGKVLLPAFEGAGAVTFYASDNDDAEPMKGRRVMEFERLGGPAMRDLFGGMAVGLLIHGAAGAPVLGSDFGMWSTR